jgi:hypothetical protein
MTEQEQTVIRETCAAIKYGMPWTHTRKQQIADSLEQVLAASALPLAAKDAVQRRRMTDIEITNMIEIMTAYHGDWVTAIVRATEKHHGIGL